MRQVLATRWVITKCSLLDIEIICTRVATTMFLFRTISLDTVFDID